MEEILTSESTKTIKTYKTCVFRIHNPSRHKRAMLDDALRRNHLAYTKALRLLLPTIEQYAALPKREREKAIKTQTLRIIRPLPISCGAKQGVTHDLHSQLESHLELLQIQETRAPPTARSLDPKPHAWQNALSDFSAAITEEDEAAARARLLEQRKAGIPRPILFVANNKTDGYLFLYNPEKSTYAVWLNLHSRNSRFAQNITVTDMVDIRTGEIVSFKSKTGAIFPVEFGADFQLAGFINKATPQSAKLVKTGDAHYEIHVTFLFEAEPVQTTTIMAVNPAYYSLASLCIMDRDGRIIDRQNIIAHQLRHAQHVHDRQKRQADKKGRRYRSKARKALADEAVHAAANKIADLAVKHASQVVFPTARQQNRTSAAANSLLHRSQNTKLHRILTYKLALRGLPPPRTVARAGTFQTCPRCGHSSPKNRKKGSFDSTPFVCVSCSYQDDAYLNAAWVMGQKRIWRDTLPAHLQKMQTKCIPQEYSFGQFLRHCAERRGEWP